MQFSPHIKKRILSPAKFIILGFLGIIIAGSFCLMLPFSTVEGSLNPLTALFTSTSAVCVTGLIILDTGTQFTFFGQLIIIIMIQIGGLGFMTAASIMMFALGKRISLRDRLAIQESMSENDLRGLVLLIKRATVLTLCIESVGAIMLSFRFIPLYGYWQGLWMSIFHGISAFCNAGFDLIGNKVSMVPFVSDSLVSLTICALIVLGGLGYAVIIEVAINHHNFRKFTLQTKIVITTTVSLIIVGAVFFFISEYNNPKTMGDLSLGGKAIASLFQSITARTAGFNSIDQVGMTNGSLLLTQFLMLIGASPASTGGGLKTTIFAMLILSVIRVLKNKEDIECFNRRVPNDIQRKMIAIVFIYLSVAFLASLFICCVESVYGNDFSLVSITYEVISAIGTVGMSMGITAELSPPSQIILMITMFAGRIGPMTLALALRKNGHSGHDSIGYVQEKIIIG